MKNMNKNLVKIMATVILTLLVIIVPGCGTKSESGSTTGTGTEKNNQSNKKDKTEKWDVIINGTKLDLPCTLADLEKVGVELYNEKLLETILETPNETFLMTEAICEEGEEVIYLKLLTGDDVAKGKKNIVVTIVTNYYMSSQDFTVKGHIGLGSDIDEVITVYGEDYVLSAEKMENFRDGIAVLQYGTGDDGLLFKATDGVVDYIEIIAEQGE